MIDNKVITNAKYIADLEGNNHVVSCTINGVGVSVPFDPANTDYAEILRQVEAGELTIADAD
jgi:hypothetical protein